MNGFLGLRPCNRRNQNRGHTQPIRQEPQTHHGYVNHSNFSSTDRSNIQKRVSTGAATAAATANSTKQKLRHGLITSEGVELSLGANGEVLATIQNKGNSIGFGYVRHDGSYSRATYTHTIRTNSSRLLAINQSKTFSANVTYKDDNKTVIAIKIDPSVKDFHVKLAGKEHLIRASDIQKLKNQSVAKPAPTPTPKPAEVPKQEEKATIPPIPPTSKVEASPSDRIATQEPSIDLTAQPSEDLSAQPTTEDSTDLSTALPLGRITRPNTASQPRAPIPQRTPATVRGLQNFSKATKSLFQKTANAAKKLGSGIRNSFKRPTATEIANGSTKATAPEAAKTTVTDATGTTAKGIAQSNMLKSAWERLRTLGKEGVARIQEFSRLSTAKSPSTTTPAAEASGAAAPTRPSNTPSTLELAPESTNQGSGRSSGSPKEATGSPRSQPTNSPNSPATEVTTIPQNQLKSRFSAWNQELKASKWAKANPFKAVTLAASVSEGVFGAMKGNYGPDDPHSPIPSLIGLLNKDFANAYTFSTQEGGLAAAIAAETMRSAGDAGITLGAFNITERGVMAAANTRLGQSLGGRVVAGAGMRVLGGVGVVYHGYSTFSDGSFAEMNDLQLAGNTASPVVAGAIMGGMVGGPIGAAGGAGLGAAGEAVGVFVGLATLESEANSSWKKREVKKSFLYADMGFILPPESELVQRHKKIKDLPEEHQEVLRRNAQITALSRISEHFSPQEMKKLGFIPPLSSDASSEAKTAASQTNWARMVQLTEGGSWVSLIYGDFIDQVRSQDPKLAQKFKAFFKESEALWRDKYDLSPSITYTVESDRVTMQSELLEYIKSVGQKIDLNNSDTQILTELQNAFPGIEVILQDTNGKPLLINQLEAATGKTGRFQRLLDLDALTDSYLAPEGEKQQLSAEAA